VARQGRRPGGQRPGPDHPGADRRHSPHHLDRHLRLGSAPLLQALPAHARGGHYRARADGDSRGGRPGRRAHPSRGPRRDPLQHKLRQLLFLRPGPLLPVRDDARYRQARPGREPARARQGREPLRLHPRLRRRPRRSGRVPARPAGPLRPHKGPGRTTRRAFFVPLGRPADELAGRRVRGRPGGWDRRHLGPRPYRPDMRQDRAAPGRRARHRHRQRARAPRDGLQARGPDNRLLGGRDRARRDPGPDRRPRSRRRHRRRRHGGERVRRRLHPPGLEGPARPGHRSSFGHVLHPAGRHVVPLGRLRGAYPGLPLGRPVRHADPGPHGPGERPPMDGRDHPAPHRGRRPEGRGPENAHDAARRRAARVRDLPEKARRRHQVRPQTI
ncbi:MAG: Threonine dehydrogenase and related Zn-dependent dehydrogenases, partial [uncultured Rubrobacteraceae bacterium]